MLFGPEAISKILLILSIPFDKFVASVSSVLSVASSSKDTALISNAQIAIITTCLYAIVYAKTAEDRDYNTA